jgi:hypothetical protein
VSILQNSFSPLTSKANTCMVERSSSFRTYYKTKCAYLFDVLGEEGGSHSGYPLVLDGTACLLSARAELLLGYAWISHLRGSIMK